MRVQIMSAKDLWDWLAPRRDPPEVEAFVIAMERIRDEGRKHILKGKRIVIEAHLEP